MTEREYARAYDVIQLVTVDSDGRPRMALLGDAEVDSRTPGLVRLLLWATSSTSDNLQVGSLGLLARVHDGGLRSTWVQVKTRETVTVSGVARVLVDGGVLEVKDDVVGYARLSHGLEFEVLDPSVGTRWEDTARVFDRRRTPRAGTG